MQLQKLFDYQAGLMDKLAPVERELGYNPPPIPLDFNLRAHQDWFRLMAWYLTEEIVETLTAKPEDKPEELADCLHFAIELCILAGVSPEQVEHHRNLDLFESLPWQFSLTDVLVSYGQAINLLKAKHWKRYPQATDLQAFRNKFSYGLYQLLVHIQAAGLDPEVIYMAKHQKNEDRIKTHY